MSESIIVKRPSNASELIALIEKTRTSVFHSKLHTNADGTPSRWRLNGQIKTFKRNAQRIYMPLKHGLYQYASITSVDEFFTYLDIPNVIIEEELLQAMSDCSAEWENAS